MADGPISGFPAVAAFLDALEFAVNDAGVSRKIAASLIRGAWGDDYLGGAVLLSAAHETPNVTLTWPPGSGIPATRKRLWIDVFVGSYGGTPDATGDIASLRVNGDSGPNYWSRHVYWAGGAWNDVPNASATLIRLAETNSRLSRNVFVTVNNVANRGKTFNIKNQTGTADATVVGELNIGGGEWVNLTDQITSVQLIDAGSNNLGSGSGFIVRGRDF